MIQVTLRFRDGIGATRPWLRPLVEQVQRALVLAGHPLVADGQFGNGTLNALKSFQRAANLPETGIMLASSWDALKPQFQILQRPVLAQIEKMMPTFHGDLDWVHAQEGHRGNPYWPGGQSGVTLDPGVDLGHANNALVESLFRPRLGDQQWEILMPVLGLKGESARDALSSSAFIKKIKIDRTMAHDVMAHVASTYWHKISDRFPVIKEASTPASVQTVLLSLAYNRGPHNHYLDSLKEPLADHDWLLAAWKVGRMQQRHKLKGIRLRRRMEGRLIRTELEELDLESSSD